MIKNKRKLIFYASIAQLWHFFEDPLYEDFVK